MRSKAGLPNIVRSIAIVCSEFEGIKSCDDRLGSANAARARAFCKAGHEVTIIFVCRSDHYISAFQKQKRELKKIGIRLLWLEEPSMILEGLDPARLSYAVYLYLKKQRYDIVHFQSSNGLGYYTALSKSIGLGFDRTLIYVDLYEPGEWVKSSNEELISSPQEILSFFLERKSVELADGVFYPSRFILNWAKTTGWKLPDRKFITQIPISVPHKLSTKKEASKIKRIVFYGRLERRHGIMEFCDALNCMPKNFLKNKGIQVTFLGSDGLDPWIGPAASYIAAIGKNWKHSWNIISDFDQADCFRFITRPEVLCVMPYRNDATGISLLECLGCGVKFLASDIPTFRELINTKDHQNVLFEQKNFSIGDHLKLAVENGLKSARFAVPRNKVELNQMRLNGDSKPSRQKTRKVFSKKPLVSVCVTHRNRPLFLRQCLASLAKQTYKNFELILMDDASDTSESKQTLDAIKEDFSFKKWQIVRQKTQIGPSANRNHAAQLAKGEFLLFVDDDNIAKPFEIEFFLRAAEYSKADILTCAYDRFRGKTLKGAGASRRWTPVGEALDLALFYNVLGDMNFFVKRNVFLQLGGLDLQAFDAGAEDAEFLTRAVLEGYRLVVVPEALFWYRHHSSNLSSRIDFYKTLMKQIKPYSEISKNYNLEHLMSLSLSLWFRKFDREDRDDRLFPKFRS